MDPVQLFKALADTTRLRCLLLLNAHDELCVCELTETLELPQPKVSHHLAALRKVGLVSDRKVGLWVHYRLNPELPDWVVTTLDAAAEGSRHQSPFADDRAALSAVATDHCAS